MADKKGLAAMLAASAPKKDEGADMDMEMEGKDAAVEDMMRALDERDAELFKAALTAFIEHC